MVVNGLINLQFMKSLFLGILIMLASGSGCKKNTTSCTVVTITNSAPGCGGWGIVVNGVKYPSRNIPAVYQQPGIFVCASYEIYDDLALCACCGGKWADIKSMSYNSH